MYHKRERDNLYVRAFCSRGTRLSWTGHYLTCSPIYKASVPCGAVGPASDFLPHPRVPNIMHQVAPGDGLKEVPSAKGRLSKRDATVSLPLTYLAQHFIEHL